MGKRRGGEGRGDEPHSVVSTATNKFNIPAKYVHPPTRFVVMAILKLQIRAIYCGASYHGNIPY